jgi:CheY-like chemotaxis protein
MTGKFALIIHPEQAPLTTLSRALTEAGLKVMAAHSGEEALRRIGNFSLLMPDVVVTPFEDPTTSAAEDTNLLAALRANPLAKNVPVVLLASGEDDERRRALRAGFSIQVPHPYEAEELILQIQLALDQHRDENLLSGSLEQLSVAEILQTCEISRRSGTIRLRSDGRGGNLWLRGGRVIDARIDDGRQGKEAVYALVEWDQGSFEADFKAVSVPERITESTAYLLLEAARLQDERQRADAAPPFAAMPDPPPLPPPEIRATHRALTLMNIAASYALDHMTIGLLETRLETARQRILKDHPALDAFHVTTDGRITLVSLVAGGGSRPTEAVVAAIAAWLKDFFGGAERVLPGRFALRHLRSLSEALQEDLNTLGFYQALGLADTPLEGTEKEL